MVFVRPTRLYAQPASPLIRRLARFERVHLTPGAKQKVIFDVDANMFAMVTTQGDRVSTPGAFVLEFSTGVHTLASLHVRLTGGEVVLDAFPRHA
jgi:hypothetical protein